MKNFWNDIPLHNTRKKPCICKHFVSWEVPITSAWIPPDITQLSENNEISKSFGIDVTCKPSVNWPCTLELHVTQRIQTEKKKRRKKSVWKIYFEAENTKQPKKKKWESERGEEVDDGDDDTL